MAADLTTQDMSTPIADEPNQTGTGSSQQTDPQVQLADLQKQLEEYVNLLQRERADFTNFRKRTEEEKKESIFFGQSLLLTKLLPLLGNFERALEHLPTELEQHDWVKGILQVKTLFDKELTSLEIERIKTVGEVFDSNVHEAVMQVPGPMNQVMAEFQAGYFFRKKVLQPARVSVGNGEEQGQ